MANVVETKRKGAAFKKFFRDVRAELKKVAWPTKRELVNYFGVVCAAIVIVCIVLWIYDACFGMLLRPILH